MFLLDSLMISGISWALKTAISAAEAEMNDDSALREALLEAEMRREMGEISDEEFGDIEADLLARIREIKVRREGGSGPLAFGGAEPMETSPDSRFQVEASISGDFYDPSDVPHTTVIEHDPGEGMIVRADGDNEIRVLDMEPGDPDRGEPAALPLTRDPMAAPRRRTRTSRTTAQPPRPRRRASSAAASPRKAQPKRATGARRPAAATRSARTARTRK
jgi:hypothetical protein